MYNQATLGPAMKEKTIDIRELQELLSNSLQEVQEGTTLIITEEGKPVARLVPANTGLEERLQYMLDSGMASWSGQKPSTDIPRVPRQGKGLVSDLLLEDRE
jgi:prevent-host-death family protein